MNEEERLRLGRIGLGRLRYIRKFFKRNKARKGRERPEIKELRLGRQH